jgi:hypothetical protein
VKVEYYEDAQGATAQVSWQSSAPNNPPTAFIDTPASTLTYAVGDLISFSGHATDPEQGALPASALSWQLIIHHCTTPQTCHIHNVQTWTGVASGTFNAPDHAYPSYLELDMTATDAGGLTNTTSVSLQPKTVNLTFNSSPSGLSLTVNSAAATTPFTTTVIQKSANSVSATSPQTLGGTSYSFSSWSDGGAATHNITAPTTDTTYTATYSQVVATKPANTGLPVVSGPLQSRKTETTTNGTWNGTQPITFTYQWLRCDSAGNNCNPIANATGATYVVQSGDVGHRFKVTVTATNSAGSTAATSTATGAVKK